MDASKLESLKNKEAHAQSAVASPVVREHLASFIRSKPQGSSTGINSIHCSSVASHQKSGQSSLANGASGSRGDDHPLRKTASMPTMHIPYKAQSLSRRRQVERRTTMSPLMKRKSRPRRQLLHSLDSSEYSSNPCILQSSRADKRSLSQSSTPPPQSLATVSDLMVDLANGIHSVPISNHHNQLKHQHQQLQQTIPSSTADAIRLESIFTNKELENFTLQSEQQQPSQRPPSVTGSGSCTGNSAASNIMSQQISPALRQHLKVKEAIRKTVIERASSRGRMNMSGSLDTDSPTRASATGGGAMSGPAVPGSGAANRRDEFRQWSLDGADLRTSAALNKLSSQIMGVFSRDIPKHRLATTNDAASMRRAQSPSSSISMGLTGNQATASVTQNSVTRTAGAGSGSHPRESRVSAPIHYHGKHHSSSSSSTSSLLSQQDSLEESSSQAIDLSSSASEASRQRQLGHHQHHLTRGVTQGGVGSSSPSRQQQSMLHESFDQMRLQGNGPAKPSHQQHAHLFGGQHPLGLSESNQQAPPLSRLNLTLSLDAPNHPIASIASLAEQFNLSASAQNLISVERQHQLLHHQSSLLAQHQFQQQQHQLNQQRLQQQQNDPARWLMLYDNLMQSNQITSSLLVQILALPEQYRHDLQRQLALHQHRHPLLADQLAPTTATAPVTTGEGQHDMMLDSLTATMGSAFANNETQLQYQPSPISRALSSPLLISANQLEASRRMQFGSGRVAGQQQQQLQQPVELVPPGGQFDSSSTVRAESEHMLVDEPASEPVKQTSIAHQSSSETSKSFILDTNNSSLDLSMSNRSNSRDSDKTSSPKSQQNQSSETSSCLSRPLNFSYTPKDPTLVNYSFIYQPIFDSSSRTGLVYELSLCNHKCICNNEENHPENSHRVLAIWRRFYDRGLMAKCSKVDSRRANLDEIQLCHGETYYNYFGRTPYERIKLKRLDFSGLPIDGLTQLECGGQGADIDTVWNEEQTPGVARMAVGCVVEAATSVASGKLSNAFAVVRPPGHHAESQQAIGFCFFNSVAIAARVLTARHQLPRVLILDWDVHHGNGTQKLFYEDKSVMYISLHRHDKGTFFPGTGDLREIGSAPGEGFNWNIAWSHDTMGDAEYLAAFRSLVMPIAREFDPSLVLVSCGFDASRGHPFNFGGYNLSPACFAHMTRQLMTLANGKLVLSLEGG